MKKQIKLAKYLQSLGWEGSIGCIPTHLCQNTSVTYINNTMLLTFTTYCSFLENSQNLPKQVSIVVGKQNSWVMTLKF